MVENDCSIGVENCFYGFQYGFKSPAIGDFTRMSSVEQLFGHVDEELGVSFDLQRLEVMVLG